MKYCKIWTFGLFANLYNADFNALVTLLTANIIQRVSLLEA